MKKYKVEYYWSSERTRPEYLSEFSKIKDTTKIRFWSHGGKWWHIKLRNNLMNGLGKWWWGNPNNSYFINWKKGKGQGIRIHFK